MGSIHVIVTGNKVSYKVAADSRMMRMSLSGHESSTRRKCSNWEPSLSFVNLNDFMSYTPLEDMVDMQKG